MPTLPEAYKEVQLVVFESLKELGRFKDGPHKLVDWTYGTLLNGSQIKAQHDQQVKRQGQHSRA